MADFILDTSTLAGGTFGTRGFEMSGEFRELQIRLSQSTTAGDAEIHWIELHYTLSGVSLEAR